MSQTIAEFLAVDDSRSTADWSTGRIPREGKPYERPLLETVEGGELKPYTRSSGFGDTYTDKTALTEWLIRMAMIGVAVDENLQLAICAHHEDPKMMKEFKEQAHANAEAGAAATRGTAIHKLTDAYDRGETPYVPPKFAPDVQAYLGLTERLFEVLEIEQFCVNEEYGCAGTPDRIVRLKRDVRLPDKYAPHKERRVIPKGTPVVIDLKTGKSMNYNHIKFACQFFLYSGAQRYTTNLDRMFWYRNYDEQMPGGDRTPWLPDGEQLDQSDGFVLHLPAGTGHIELRPIDLEKGRHVAEFVKQVREERKLKTIGPKIDVPMPTWAEKLAEALSPADLYAAYEAANAAGEWTAELTVLAAARKQEMTA